MELQGEQLETDWSAGEAWKAKGGEERRETLICTATAYTSLYPAWTSVPPLCLPLSIPCLRIPYPVIPTLIIHTRTRQFERPRGRVPPFLRQMLQCRSATLAPPFPSSVRTCPGPLDTRPRDLHGVRVSSCPLRVEASIIHKIREFASANQIGDCKFLIFFSMNMEATPS